MMASNLAFQSHGSKSEAAREGVAAVLGALGAPGAAHARMCARRARRSAGRGPLVKGRAPRFILEWGKAAPLPAERGG